MKLKSIRNGFANNSSSSHSIIFMGDEGDFSNQDTEEGDNFGWQYFTAVNQKSKREYLFSTLLRNGNLIEFIPRTVLSEKIGWINPTNEYSVRKKYKTENLNENQQAYIDLAEKVETGIKWETLKKEFSDVFGEELIEDWKNREMNAENRWDTGIPDVDHQSVLALPVHPNGRLHIHFIKQFFKFLIEKNFAILGGNDNGGDEHPLGDRDTASNDPIVNEVKKILGMVGTYGNAICVYDELNDDFILQYNENGNKVRVSFNNNNQTRKSSFPELVDLKITDNCDYGCAFCYQSSTKEGKHGDINNIENIIKTLSNSNVMEIAIGGGEPTMHPNLLRILQNIRSRNIIACFTTKNFEEIIKTSNSIAFSCNSSAEIEKVEIIQDAIGALELYSNEKAKIYIQMIPELMSNSAFDKALTTISKMYDVSVTLLGYKDFGFGEKYAPKNRFKDSSWIDTVKKHSGEYKINFGIDSVLVSKWKDALIEKGVDPLAMVGEEGKFSCYVDAVSMTIHKSSFSKDAGIQLTGEEETIKEQFATF